MGSGLKIWPVQDLQGPLLKLCFIELQSVYHQVSLLNIDHIPWAHIGYNQGGI